MHKSFFIFALVFHCSSLFAFDLNHSKWAEVLSKYNSSDGFVSYARLKDDLKSEKDHPLASYLSDLQSVKSSEFNHWSTSEQKAFLINAYNAFTIQLILERYPIQSIKELSGFLTSPWKRNFFSLLEGKYKNLERIEKDLTRGPYKDARIYSVLSTASISSPRLSMTVFTGDKLDAQLNAALSEFLADPSRNHYDVKLGVLELSRLFDWHGDDFKDSYGGVVKTVERFAPRSAQEAIRRGAHVHFLSWDWDLNEPNGDRGVAVFEPAPDPKTQPTPK